MAYAVRMAGGTRHVDTNDQEGSHRRDHAAYKATTKWRAGLDTRMDRHLQRRELVADASAVASGTSRAVLCIPRADEEPTRVVFLGDPLVLIRQGEDTGTEVSIPILSVR